MVDHIKSRLQKTLQAAVQAVRWTYSLFWQLCPQQRILVWRDGYYNGEIKTRKTVQPIEVSTEEATLQRSQQLRELYEFLSAGGQPRRPSMALSPEDLTETEWFYLLCISFTFPPGVGLPGKAYAKGQHLWLTRANEVDSKVFSRAILAKSARIQTVIFIPLLDGVVELGTIARIEEDVGVVQRVKSFFNSDPNNPNCCLPRPALSEHSTSNPMQNPFMATFPTNWMPVESDQLEDHSRQQDSGFPSSSMDAMAEDEDTHYCRTVSTVIGKNSWSEQQRPAVPSAASAFFRWSSSFNFVGGGHRGSQFALKYLLFKAPIFHAKSRDRPDSAALLRANHAVSERRRGEKLNKRFMTLRSLVPFATKMDKASILGDVIEYVKQLRRKIVELEAEKNCDVRICEKRNAMIGNERDGGEKKEAAAARVEVSIIERDALVEMECIEREGLLLDVMQVLCREFGMEICTVRSSILDGVFALDLRAKVKENADGRKTSIMEVKKVLSQVILG